MGGPGSGRKPKAANAAAGASASATAPKAKAPKAPKAPKAKATKPKSKTPEPTEQDSTGAEEAPLPAKRIRKQRISLAQTFTAEDESEEDGAAAVADSVDDIDDDEFLNLDGDEPVDEEFDPGDDENASDAEPAASTSKAKQRPAKGRPPKRTANGKPKAAAKAKAAPSAKSKGKRRAVDDQGDSDDGSEVTYVRGIGGRQRGSFWDKRHAHISGDRGMHLSNTWPSVSVSSAPWPARGLAQLKQLDHVGAAARLTRQLWVADDDGAVDVVRGRLYKTWNQEVMHLRRALLLDWAWFPGKLSCEGPKAGALDKEVEIEEDVPDNTWRKVDFEVNPKSCSLLTQE